jgi:hypothetical protein
MDIIIKKLLSVLGWQKLLLMVWHAVQPDLQAHAEKTDTKIDDNVVKFLDEIVNAITT